MNRLWTIILCGGAIIGISVGIRQSFGLFLSPISETLGLGREVFALTIGLVNLVWGALAPVAGALSDKYGPARVAIAGTALYCAGIYMISTAGGEADLILAGGLLGVGMSGLGFTVVLGAVGRAAPPEKRSMALGLASMGGSIGQFAALPYAHVLIEQMGWASSLIVMMFTAALMAPLAFGLREGPAAAQEAGGQTLRQALGEALSHRGFILLTAGFFVCGFHVTFVATHLPSYLADQSFEPWLGASALTLVGLANIFGVVAAGRLGQAIEKRLALGYYYLLRSILFLAFILVPPSETAVLVFAFALGLLWLGTVPLTSGLVATLFGPRYMSMLFGIVYFSHHVGGFLGAWLGGYIYDAFGSYAAMWWISIALGVMSALFHWPIREVPVERLATEGART